MEELLLEIADKLDKYDALKYVDENWGQLDSYGQSIPVKWPCALIHISGGTFSNMGYNHRESEMLQQGTLSVEITIADMKLTNTSTKAPASQRAKGFGIYNLLGKVHELLQGWKPLDSSGAMVRTSFQGVIRDDGVQEKRIIYTIGLNGC